MSVKLTYQFKSFSIVSSAHTLGQISALVNLGLGFGVKIGTLKDYSGIRVDSSASDVFSRYNIMT